MPQQEPVSPVLAPKQRRSPLQHLVDGHGGLRDERFLSGGVSHQADIERTLWFSSGGVLVCFKRGDELLDEYKKRSGPSTSGKSTASLPAIFNSLYEQSVWSSPGTQACVLRDAPCVRTDALRVLRDVAVSTDGDQSRLRVLRDPEPALSRRDGAVVRPGVEGTSPKPLRPLGREKEQP